MPFEFAACVVVARHTRPPSLRGDRKKNSTKFCNEKKLALGTMGTWGSGRRRRAPVRCVSMRDICVTKHTPFRFVFCSNMPPLEADAIFSKTQVEAAGGDGRRRRRRASVVCVAREAFVGLSEGSSDDKIELGTG